MCWNLCWEFCRIIFRGCLSLLWSILRGTPRMQFKRETQEQMKVLPMILPNPLWHGWNLMTWSHRAAGQHRLQEAERTKQERPNAMLGHMIMWPRFLQRRAPPHLPLRHRIWLQKMSKRGVIPRLMSQVKLENWRGSMVVFLMKDLEDGALFLEWTTETVLPGWSVSLYGYCELLWLVS